MRLLPENQSNTPSSNLTKAYSKRHTYLIYKGTLNIHLKDIKKQSKLPITSNIYILYSLQTPNLCTQECGLMSEYKRDKVEDFHWKFCCHSMHFWENDLPARVFYL